MMPPGPGGMPFGVPQQQPVQGMQPGGFAPGAPGMWGPPPPQQQQQFGAPPQQQGGFAPGALDPTQQGARPCSRPCSLAETTAGVASCCNSPNSPSPCLRLFRLPCSAAQSGDAALAGADQRPSGGPEAAGAAAAAGGAAKGNGAHRCALPASFHCLRRGADNARAAVAKGESAASGAWALPDTLCVFVANSPLSQQPMY